MILFCVFVIFCLFNIYILVCANLILVEYFSIFFYILFQLLFIFLFQVLKCFYCITFFSDGSSEFTPYIWNQKYSAPLQTCQNFHINFLRKSPMFSASVPHRLALLRNLMNKSKLFTRCIEQKLSQCLIQHQTCITTVVTLHPIWRWVCFFMAKDVTISPNLFCR